MTIKNAFLTGAYVEKTDAFCTNTSIVYSGGEQIASWKVDGKLNIPVRADVKDHT